MRRAGTISGAFAAVLILVGCSGSGSVEEKRTNPTSTTSTTTTTTTPVPIDTAKVDTILGDAIRATQLLTLPPGPNPEVLSAYTQAAELFDQAARALRGGVTGVPKKTSHLADLAFKNLAAVTRAHVTCLRDTDPAAVGSEPLCSDETTDATNAGLVAGAAVASLIPFGTRSAADVGTAVGAAPH